jgi:glycosyltransferase involved in cell wall biosynthesis
VLGQTRTPIEVLVVDDGSTDETPAIVARFPVKLLATGQNSGHATARNLGIAAARGDLIAWIDADDMWEPDHLEIVGALLDHFPEASVAYSSVRLFGSRDGVWHGAAREEITPRNHFWDSLKSTCVPAMSAVTRSVAIRRVGGFEASIRISPDFATWLRMSLADPFVGTRQVTARYRWHNHQISSSRGFRDISFVQQRSVYASRYALVEELQRVRSNDAPFLEKLVSCVQDIYRSDLRRATTTDDKLALEHLLTLSPFVPNGVRIALPYRIASRTPNWILRPLSRARQLARRCVV